LSEEPFLEEQLRAIYASKSRTSKNTARGPKSIFPLIPKEQYKPLSDDIKDILRQQHAFYRDQIRALQKDFPGSHSTPNWSLHFTHAMSLPEDMYRLMEQEGEGDKEEISSPNDQETDLEDLSYPPSNNSSKNPEVSMYAVPAGSSTFQPEP